MLLPVLLMLIAFCAEGAHAAPPEVKKTEAPQWVESVPVKFDAVRKVAQAEGGSYFLLMDRQYNVQEAAEYRHFANRFLTQGAVENGSRISITFDPSYQELTLHKLVVHRNGQAMDRLPGQAVNLLQRETGLDRNLYDGRLSAEVILEDIRVGDVLEYAYSCRGENPLFVGRCEEIFHTSLDKPIEHLRTRLLCPTSRPLKMKAFGRAPSPVVSTRGEATEYVWEDRNVPAIISDGEVPSWFDPWSWVQLTEFPTWADVAQWMSGIYVVPTELPEELQNEVRQIKQLESEEARALAALRYVQDNIRYLGIEVGVNTHKPYPLETILARRFGDCKDKALMLCTMLRHLGFEADPALAGTEESKTIAEWLPSPSAFNHLVVRLRYHGLDIWLDPTYRDQGGQLEKIYFPDYGYSLIISPQTTALTRVRPGGFAESSREVTEMIELKDFQGSATLRVHSIFRGSEADEMRSTLTDSSLETLRKKYLNFYANAFPDIKMVADPVTHDDRAENVLTMEESYEMSNLWKPSEDEKEHKLSTSFTSLYMRTMDLSPNTAVRSMPFEIDHPRKLTHVIEVNFPKKLNIDPDRIVANDPAFSFEYSAAQSDRKFTLRYFYESRADHVTPAAMPKYLESVKRLRRAFSYEITVPETWAKYSALSWLAADPTSLEDGDGQDRPMAATRAVGITLAIVLVIAGLIVWGVTRRSDRSADETPALHRCAVCGETERSNAALEFRVAADGEDYCHRHRPPASSG